MTTKTVLFRSATFASQSFMTRRSSTGDASRSIPPKALLHYPPSTPGHDCREFCAPEGTYQLINQVFFRSLTPLFSTGTTASLVSIKYKETIGNQLQRYTPQPGARSFRGIFGNSHGDSDEDSVVARPSSLSSSSSSFRNNNNKNSITPVSPTPIPEEKATSFTIPKLGSSLEGPSFASPQLSPSPSTSESSTTLALFSRNSSMTRRRSRGNVTKTNSSLVSQIITNNELAKILVARTSEDTNLFYNCGSTFVWVDAFGHPKEPLSRVIFSKAYPTTHDVNLLTRGSDHLDIIIGFTSGDIVWFDPLTNKYSRINKGGVMNASSINMIKWLQGSESLFMAAFADGSVMIFDKDKEDEVFVPGDAIMQSSFGTDAGRKHVHGMSYHLHHRQAQNGVSAADAQKLMQVRRNVSKPSPKISSRCNPVSHWKLSEKAITAFAFSPDCQHVAVVGLDGGLRVINFLQETLNDIYQSYYGGLLCVAWSPDGRYILTGGEDDLVTIWAFREQRIVARCQGHNSWVTGVAFDAWRCDEKVYRFASVGEDANLILWDFSVNALHRPKTRTGTRHRGASVSSQHTVAPASSILGAIQDQPPTLHPVTPKNEVAVLQPTMIKTVHADPCVGVYFREDVIVTTDRRGRVSVWQRPSATQTPAPS